MRGVPGTAELREAAITLACRSLSLPFLLFRGPRKAVFDHVVIVKPGSLGDVLMSTAAVHAVRYNLPAAHLAYAVGQWSRPMLASNPHLDALLDLGRVGSGPYTVSEYVAAVRLLRSGRFDAAFVLDRSPLISALPLLAGIPHRFGLDSAGRGFSLTRGSPCPDHRHEAELYLDVVEAASLAPIASRLEFFPSLDEESALARLMSAAVPEGWDSRPLVAAHPGGGVNPGMTLLAKRWAADRFAALSDRMESVLGARVVLVGGPDDVPLVASVKAAMRAPALDLAGKLTWGQLGALLRRARLLVANDTGAAHLAVAVGTPVVAIFGPTDPAQYGPFRGKGEAVTAGEACSPCFRHGRMPPCPFALRCLSGLRVETVWAAVQRQWGGLGRLSPATVREGGA